MPFPRKLLNETEEVVLDLHPHWWFLAKQTLALLAAIVIGALVLLNVDNGIVQLLAGVLILAALGWWIVRYLDWRTTNFVVTSDRLIYRHGVVAKHGIEIPLERVNNVLFSQRLFERMLGAGDLVIESAGESGRQAFSDVRKPSAVQNEIYRQIEANENRKFDRIGQGHGGGGSGSVADELAKLDELRRNGILSEEEFAAQKARLLGH
ncbi:PH domain-containing protein [Acidimicrobiia bacterium EGI L10123]|uniref:PH domain-containing protein n=1 Tax=Salinilacustrithrix flava TaxID=2957203 RepID=UPI003D7C1872|nr:PH domain-containing protein [Acidimicrobiia bacterium EGI L10123]